MSSKYNEKETVAAQWGFVQGKKVVVVMEIIDEKEVDKYMKSAIGYEELLPGMKILSIGQLSKREDEDTKKLIDYRKEQLLTAVEDIYNKLVITFDEAIIDATVKRGTEGEYQRVKQCLGIIQ